MAVIGVTTWEVRFGALPEFMPVLSASKRIHEGLGAKVRAWQLGAAGPNVGRVLYTVRFDSHRALAVYGKELASDPEWLKLLQDNANRKGVNIAGQVVASELRGLEAAPLKGDGGPRARLTRGWQVDAGRAAEATTMLLEMKAQVARFGGEFSTVVGLFAGPNSGQLTSISEFADAEARGAYLDAASSDAALMAAQSRFMAAGSPMKLVGASLTLELPI